MGCDRWRSQREIRNSSRRFRRRMIEHQPQSKRKIVNLDHAVLYWLRLTANSISVVIEPMRIGLQNAKVLVRIDRQANAFYISVKKNSFDGRQQVWSDRKAIEGAKKAFVSSLNYCFSQLSQIASAECLQPHLVFGAVIGLAIRPLEECFYRGSSYSPVESNRF